MKTVVILGVGALGSHVVQLLRSCEVTMRVVDCDRVERKNVASQFHGRGQVGKSKVQSLGQLMLLLFGDKLETIVYRLVDDNVERILAGCDLVIECFDNGVSRRLVQRYVRAQDLPCVHGALDAEGSFGRVIWDERFVVDDEPDAGAATCEDGAHLPFIGIVSSYLARASQIFLTHGDKVDFSISPAGAIRA